MLGGHLSQNNAPATASTTSANHSRHSSRGSINNHLMNNPNGNGTTGAGNGAGSRPYSRNGYPQADSTLDPVSSRRLHSSSAASTNSTSSSTPLSSMTSASSRPFIRQGQSMRRDSTASTFSTLSEASQPWTRADIGFNAISGVLNNPTKRPSSAAKPTKTDIPPVAPVSIRKVKASEFDSYIKHITPVFERYQGNRAGSKPIDGANIHSPRSPFGASFDSVVSHLQPQIAMPSLDEASQGIINRTESARNPYSVPDLSEINEPVPMKPAVPAMPDTPALNTVPSIFFDPNFNFENPRTFDLVCEQTGPAESRNTTTSIVTNSILQEKLSHYLDTVEIHLMTEISRRSTSFFEALSNLQALHSQTLECVSQIHVLRAQLARIDHTQSKQGLEVVRLKRRRRNLGLLHNGIRMVKEIRSTQPMIQVLLGKADYFGALDLIDGAQQVLIEGDMKYLETTPGFDPSLALMRKMIGKMMEGDLVDLLINDFRLRIGKLDVATLLTDLGKVERESDLQEKMMPLVQGLLRANRAGVALQTFREQILQEFKNIIKSQYVSIQASRPYLTTTLILAFRAALTNQLRTMDPVTFYKMLSFIYAFLLGALQRVSLYHQLLLHLAQLFRQLETESEEILFAVADLAHSRCAKLMGMRSEQSAKLLPAEVYKLLKLTWSFVLQSELLSGYMCYGLRTAILSQSKAFLLQFHMEKTSQLALAVGEDQWAQVEVPWSSQSTANEITAISSLKYLDILNNITALTTDVMQRIIELLKLFNSRTCQVILGAGAMRSAGLKNITAKHLALASQSLSVFATLIPYVKDWIRSKMTDKQMVMLTEFDRILRDFQEHQNEIHSKLVAIMTERLALHVRSMTNPAVVDYDALNKPTQQLANGGASVNAFMDGLVKDATTLHKVLSRFLPATSMR
ncbi:MAG: Vps54-like protein-domain-containing protein, partial [Linnemannia elongata]